MRFEDLEHRGLYVIAAYDLLVRLVEDPKRRAHLDPVFRDLLTYEVAEGDHFRLVTVARAGEVAVASSEALLRLRSSHEDERASRVLDPKIVREKQRDYMRVYHARERERRISESPEVLLEKARVLKQKQSESARKQTRAGGRFASP